MIIKDTRTINYYKVPVLKVPGKCCFCGSNLSAIPGKYYCFSDDHAGEIRSVFHYCESCGVGFKTDEELGADISLIRQLIKKDIRVETVDANRVNSANSLLRSVGPEKCINPMDTIMMGVDSNRALRFATSRMVENPSFENWMIAIKVALKEKKNATINLWKRQYASQLTEEELHIIDSYCQDYKNGLVSGFNTEAIDLFTETYIPPDITLENIPASVDISNQIKDLHSVPEENVAKIGDTSEGLPVYNNSKEVVTNQLNIVVKNYVDLSRFSLYLDYYRTK